MIQLIDHYQRGRRLWLCLSLWLCLPWMGFAQDPQFTQFYAAPLFLNPALTGMASDLRLTANYRDQWSGLPSNYDTYMVGVDHFFAEKSFSMGFMAKQDLQGAKAGTPLSQLTLGLSGAYLLHLKNGYSLNLGLQLGLIQTSLNFHSLIFGDQLVDGGPTGEVFPSDNVFVPEIGTGAVLFNRRLWVGAAIQHINKPNITFLKDKGAYLPARFSLQAGYQIPLKRQKRKKELFRFDDFVLTPTVLYKAQGKWDQLSAGLYADMGPLIAGFWYRGIPYLKRYDRRTVNHDGLSFLLGLKLATLRVGYSYDVTLTKLPFDKAGSHELSVSYVLQTYKAYRKKPKKKKEEVVCPIPWI